MKRLIVDTQGARLRKDGQRIQVEHEGQILQSVPVEQLEQVLLMGQGVSASTPLMHDLVQRGVDVVYMSQNGRYAFRLAGALARHSALRTEQVRVAADGARALALARAIVWGKIGNQAVVLGRYRAVLGEAVDEAREAIEWQRQSAARAIDLETLRGHEGYAARAYFGAWRGALGERYGFEGREYHPPRDPINALLSLGYTLLLNDITALVYRVGLDPAIGFFHTVDYGRPSLALDLEEEFRPLVVDNLVLAIVTQGQLLPVDFRTTESGTLLTDDARRFFLTQYDGRLQAQVRHPGRQQTFSYRQCLELQVEHMARCIQGRDAEYQPLLAA